jgi:hypothetical protein
MEIGYYYSGQQLRLPTSQNFQEKGETTQAREIFFKIYRVFSADLFSSMYSEKRVCFGAKNTHSSHNTFSINI